jgi:hypothetical protein
MANMPEERDIHSCSRCENIVLPFDESIHFPYEKATQAKAAGCGFFQMIFDKLPITNTTSSFGNLELVLSCTGVGDVDLKWIDAADTLFDTSDDQKGPPFTMFALDNSSRSDRSEYRPLNANPKSPASTTRMRRWLNTCRRDHDECRKHQKKLPQKCPTRLIKVSGANPKVICICSPGSNEPYAVLSYCWGGEQELQTTRARLEQRRSGFPLEELPQTIQEAVQITRQLKLEYLWVDSICILQDEDSDKEREMKDMGDIYAGACITIAAARAKGAKEGFLQERTVKERYGAVYRVRYRRIVAGHEETGSSLLCTESLNNMYDDPIDERGWTFQERYRSFRTLRIGRKQTVWECPNLYDVDGGRNYVIDTSSEGSFTGTIKDDPYPYEWNDPFHKHDLHSILTVWQLLVNEYSKRDLKVKTDRLPAFAAMAGAFGAFLRLQPDQYWAGLWKFDICEQLLWRRAVDNPGKKWDGEKPRPTWSWVSLRGAVNYDQHPRWPQAPETYMIRGVQCNINLKSPEFGYGEVLSASLTVIGVLVQITLLNGCLVAVHRPTVGSFLYPIEIVWDYQEERTTTLWCLEIRRCINERTSKSTGIVLSKTADNTYNRVGYFELDHSSKISGHNILVRKILGRKISGRKISGRRISGRNISGRNISGRNILKCFSSGQYREIRIE